MQEAEIRIRAGEITNTRRMLCKEYPGSIVDLLMQPEKPPFETASAQSVTPGLKFHPFDMRMATQLQVSNSHHARCIHAKASSTVGIGFEKDETSKILCDFCEGSFQSILNAVAEDYWQTGNGFIEVIRDQQNLDKITGLHWLPAQQVYVVVEDMDTYQKHFEVWSTEGAGNRVFALFGDLKDFMERRGKGLLQGFASGSTYSGQKKVAELIHFKRDSTLSRWYGLPDSLASATTIELAQMLKQHTMDFFVNRGVPEFLLFLLGEQLNDKEWKTVLDSMKAHIGIGNSFKSNAFNFGSPNMKIELHKLASDIHQPAQFTELAQILAHEIVSAHGVPPLLAGIQIPGRLGAVNELPNALVGFQVLVIGPAQHKFAQTLDATLGNPKLNGGLPLEAGDFAFKTITNQLDIAAVDTAARMQDSVASPAGQARLAEQGGLTGFGSAGLRGPSNTTANPTPPSGLAPGAGMGGRMLKEATNALDRYLGMLHELAGQVQEPTDREIKLLNALEKARSA